VNNDVEAAEKLLAEIIVAAEADGIIDEEEQVHLTASLDKVVLQKSFPTKIRQLILYHGGFVRELTLQNDFIDTLCEIRVWHVMIVAAEGDGIIDEEEQVQTRQI
jgi:uncharacterized membrane protein YebE (DUF533 family)